MQYTHLGRSGVIVSRLCLGTMNFGWGTNEQDSFKIMDAALDAGINFIDTANVYGFTQKIGEGLTEQIIGKWLAQGDRREKIVLATKVYGPMGTGPNDAGLSAYHIFRAVEQSLKRLQTDCIDVLYMHHVDRGEMQPMIKEWFGLPQMDMVRPPHIKNETRWEEIWGAMETLVQQGKVRYIASSNFAGWNIAQASEIANSRHFLGLVAEQCQYNLNSRMPEMEVIPACREYGIGLVPYSPLSEGMLAGGILGAKEGRRAELGQRADALKEKLDAYYKLCREIGEKPADVAVAWVIDNPVVSAPIIGPRTMEQLTGSLRAVEINLAQEVIAKLDDIWPRPGTAPEAWAW